MPNLLDSVGLAGRAPRRKPTKSAGHVFSLSAASAIALERRQRRWNRPGQTSGRIHVRHGPGAHRCSSFLDKFRTAQKRRVNMLASMWRLAPGTERIQVRSPGPALQEPTSGTMEIRQSIR